MQKLVSLSDYLRPWKLFSLACGITILIVGAYVQPAPDWDIPISFIFQGKGSIDPYDIEIQILKKNGSVRTIENLHIAPNSSGDFT